MNRRRKVLSRIADRDFPEIRAQFKAVENPGLIKNFLAEILTRPNISNPVVEVPLKNTRLQQLADAGFNYVDFRFWPKGQLNLSELEKFFGFYGKLSLRNFTEEKYGDPSPRLPVMYNVGQLSLVRSFCLENNKSYHTLVNEVLPLEDSVCSGNLVLWDDQSYLVSCIRGYGTPRDVDEKDAPLLVFMGSFGERTPDWTPPFITDMADSLHNFLPKLRPITIEFSLYPYEVGQLKRKEVFWEWRGGSLYDINVMAAHCLTQSNSYEIRINMPLRAKVR